MAVSEHHIRESVVRYLSGKLPLEEFQTWFVPRAWEILDAGTPAADLVSQIELLLAEFTNGDLSEDELREALTPYGSVAVLDASSVDVSWDAVTSAQPVSTEFVDMPQRGQAWIRMTSVKEAQPA